MNLSRTCPGCSKEFPFHDGGLCDLAGDGVCSDCQDKLSQAHEIAFACPCCQSKIRIVRDDEGWGLPSIVRGNYTVEDNDDEVVE